MDDASPRIAVIENDGSVRDMLKDLLEFEGYTVLASPDCERGYAFVKQERPDLVILDQCPSVHALGWTTLEWLAGDAETAAIPTLVCSATHDGVKDQLASKHPAIGWVTKPFEVDDLLNVIETMLAERVSEEVAA